MTGGQAALTRSQLPFRTLRRSPSGGWGVRLLALALGVAFENAPARAEEQSAAPPAEQGSSELLSRAEEAMTRIDYEGTRSLVEQALERGGLSIEEHTRAYTLLALASAQLDDGERAEAAFRRLFALDPQSNVAMRLSPSRRTPMLNARGYWSVRKGRFYLDVAYSRRDQDLVLSVHDPIDWIKIVEVGWRFGQHPYARAQRSVTPGLTLHVGDIGVSDNLEVYARGLDEHGNVVLEFGRERDPHVFEPSEQELAEMRRRDIRGGQTGSFARRLEELGVQVGVHGYTSLELAPNRSEAAEEEDAAEGQAPRRSHVGFDLHHATAMIRASMLDTAAVEVALEWEHLGRDEADGFYFPHAFMDLRFSDLLILRAGFFEAPVGAFNEYLYPDFLRITALPPLFAGNVVPSLWSEVGVQARGRVQLGSVPTLTYALFFSNGLEQPDEHPSDGMIAEGAEISTLRFNVRDEHDGHKGIGGRVGIEAGESDVGISGYTGQYTAEQGKGRRLSIFDADVSLRNELLTFRAEGAIALQETTEQLIARHGFYLLGAARPISYVEPYLQYDYIDNAAPADPGRRFQRVLAGFALYPFPQERVTSSLRLKSEGGFEFPQTSRRVSFWHFQLTMGF